MDKGLYAVLAIGMLLLFSYMAAWIGLTSLLTHLVHKRFGATLGALSFPLFWVAQEKLREMGEISFPWITAGYSFGAYNKLLQALSLFGVYFYSLLIASTSVLLFIVIKRIKEKEGGWIAHFVIILLLYAILLFYGTARVKSFDKNKIESARVAIIQPNVDPLIKWERRRADSIFQLNIDMTTNAFTSENNIDLAIWPESALPVYFGREARYRRIISSLADSLSTSILFGALDIDFTNNDINQPNYYNSVFFKAPHTQFVRYDKINLLPFAERLPFEGIFPIISRVDLGEADFTHGKLSTVYSIQTAAGPLNVFTPICYEVVYQKAIANFVKNGGKLMAQVTNDGWFGRSAMPYQHLNIALFRSIEFGIPLARAANTGISAIADACGRISLSTPIYESRILVGNVKTNTMDTLFTFTGDIIGTFSGIAALLLLITIIIKKPRSKTGQQ